MSAIKVYKVLFDRPVEDTSAGMEEEGTFATSSYDEALKWGQIIEGDTGAVPIAILEGTVDRAPAWNKTELQGGIVAREAKVTEEAFKEARRLPYDFPKGATWGEEEGLTRPGVKEIEFLCANSRYPGYKENLRKHQELYQRLQRPGLLPYRQDFSEGRDKQYALAVIILDPAMEKYALQQAREVSLPIDLEQDAPAWKVDEVRQGRADYQIRTKQTRTKGKTPRRGPGPGIRQKAPGRKADPGIREI